MKRLNIIALAMSALLFACTPQREVVDLIVINAVIHTADAEFSIAEAMAIHDGIILAVGSKKDLLKSYDPVEVHDAEGRALYPGFYDPHCHFYHYGAGLATRADLTGTTSFEEVLGVMKRFAAEHPEGWLVGRGWDQNNWPVKEFPDNEELNRLFPDRPVVLIRVDGHAVLANDVALKRAGIDHRSVIQGGEIQKRSVTLTGILLDKAADIMKELFLEETTASKAGGEELIRGILQGQENCFAVGLTTVGDAGLENSEIALLRQLQNDNRLKMNIYAMITYTPENISEYISKGVYHDGKMHIRSVKFYADGALGSRGALLLEPYSDKPGYHGILTLEPEEFAEQCRELYNYGYQVNTHAIGDSANRLVLKTYARVLQQHNDARWRVEHAQVVHPEDMHYFTAYDIVPAINTTHATSDMGWAGERLGSERVRYAYAYQDLLEAKGWLCNGSDFPMEQINPLLGFYAAVSRQDLHGMPEGGWQPENKLSREDALRAMTIWAARACFEEREKGSLEPGKRADFVILDQDIMVIPVEKIPTTKVISTWINGVRIHGN
ncbi:MAG: amidohydrolase [Bacteroidales bacterium]